MLLILDGKPNVDPDPELDKIDGWAKKHVRVAVGERRTEYE